MDIGGKLLDWTLKARAAELAGDPERAATLRGLVRLAADDVAARRDRIRTHLGLQDDPGPDDLGEIGETPGRGEGH